LHEHTAEQARKKIQREAQTCESDQGFDRHAYYQDIDLWRGAPDDTENDISDDGHGDDRTGDLNSGDEDV